MNDMERREFEDSIAKAFSDAEVQPSDRVWNNIELDLMKADAANMKKRVFFWQMMAAASVAFAMIAGGIGFYAYNYNDAQNIAVTTSHGNATNDQNRANNNERGSGTSTSQSATTSDTNSTNRKDHTNIASAEDGKDHTTKRRDIDSFTGSDEGGRDQITNKTLSNDRLIAQRERTQLQDAEVSNNEYTINNSASNSRNAEHDNRMARTENGASNYQDGTPRENVGNDQPGMADNTSDQSTESTTDDADRLPGLYTTREPQLAFNADKTSEADPVALMLQRARDRELELAQSEKKANKKESDVKERLWTSVAFAAGSFSGGQSVDRGSALMDAPQSSFNTNATVLDNQTKASGISYSFGLSMGTRITDRLVLQGGVNYLTESSNFTSTQAMQDMTGNFKAVTVNEYRSDASAARKETFIPTAPYSVNTSSEYVSVPIQAGYLIIKRRFAWQLNAGISTDLFIQNTVDPEGNIQETTQGRGAESPYRPLNFSGLFGSEFSYRLGERYRLGINPGIRYPFNSIYKDDLEIESTPITFDVGLRFRYIFR